MTDTNWLPIVISYQPGTELVDCVESLLAAGAPEVVVWDNSPTPAARSILGERAHVRILGDSTNYGFGTANNKAFQSVFPKPEYVFFVNPDCSVRQNTADILINALDQARDLAIVVPKMIYADGATGIAGGPFPTILKEVVSTTQIDDLLPRRLKKAALSLWNWKGRTSGRHGFDASFRASGTVAVDWVSGFAMMCRSDAFESVGGFSDEYFLYYEDVDLCQRAASAGFRVGIVNDTSAVHLESVSTGKAKKSLHYRNGRRMYFRLHGNTIQRVLANLL